MNIEHEDNIIDYIQEKFREAEAYHNINMKSNEAHSYCQKYLSEAWGKNIWHAILEDVIKLRKELNRL